MVTNVQDVQAISAEKKRTAKSAKGRVVPAEWLKNRNVKKALFALGDVSALVASHIIAAIVVQEWLRVPRAFLNPRDYWFFYLPFLLIVLYLLDRSRSPDLRRPEKELELAVKGISFAFLLLISANFIVFRAAGFSRYLMLTWYGVALPLVIASRFGLRHFYSVLWRHGLARRRTLLVGSVDRLSELHSLLAIQRYQAYEIVGMVCADEPLSGQSSDQPIRRLGMLSEWREIANQSEVEQIIVCMPQSSDASHRTIWEILHNCLPAGIDVQVFSDLFASRQFNYELDEFSGFFRFFAAPRWSRHVQLAAKKMLDFAAGILGSAITLILVPLIAVLIKAEDGGPVFFRSKYIDIDGNVATCLKFRSMCENAEQMLADDPKLRARFEEKYKLLDDPRVLRVGRLLRKYSLDELPQFFAVFCGRLSLVGPRIIAANQIGRYGDSLPKLLSVKPGLTGFWQVMGRQSTSYEVKVRMDMFYIDHWSIWLDLWIIARTFLTILLAEGAY